MNRALCVGLVSVLLGIVVLCSCGNDDVTRVEDQYDSTFSFSLELLPHPITDSIVQGIHFVDESTGFLVAYGGEIVRTKSGGLSWEVLDSGVDVPLKAAFFLDKQTGFVVGGCYSSVCGDTRGVVLKTIDGGDTWTRQVFLDVLPFEDVAFASAEIGVAVGSGLLARTTDAGDIWELDPVAGWLWDVEFLDEATGIACGFGGTILKTDDAGLTWRSVGAFEDSGFYDIDVSQDLILIVGQSVVAASEDQGETWTELAVGTEMYGVRILSPSAFLGVGRDLAYPPQGAKTLLTNDAGRTWDVNIHSFESGGPSPTLFVGLQFPKPNVGYAGGNRYGMAKIVVEEIEVMSQ